MARLCLVVKNERKKRLVAKYLSKRLELKKIVNSQTTTYEEKMAASERLQKLPKGSSPVQVRSRCTCCGRSRGVYSDFGLCRLCFRRDSHQGFIPGMTKSSW